MDFGWDLVNGAILVSLDDLASVVVQNCLTILTEHVLDSGDNRCCFDDFVEKRLNVVLEDGVAGVVANLPLVLVGIQNGLNGENGHDLLLITLDVVLEVEKSSLD